MSLGRVAVKINVQMQLYLGKYGSLWRNADIWKWDLGKKTDTLGEIIPITKGLFALPKESLQGSF